MSVVVRARELVRRLGPLGAVRLVAGRASPWTSWHAEYVWYGLDLHGDRPRRTLEDGLELRRGGVDDMALLDQLPSDPQVASMTSGLVASRLGEGAQLWLVAEGDRAAFRCWIFRGSAPLQGARGNAMRVPEGVALLEDSLSSPDFRGRGVAPGAWSGLADVLGQDGSHTMVTKVRVDNAPTRRAVEKAGFRAVGTMAMAGPAWRTRIRVDLEPGAETAYAWLRGVQR